MLDDRVPRNEKKLKVSGGKLVVFDPSAYLRIRENHKITIPRGVSKVVVTLAVSEEPDKPHLREAYASLSLLTVPKPDGRSFTS